MADFPESAFGHPQRHYSSHSPADVGAGNQELNKQVARLLHERDAEMPNKVQRAFKQWNNIVRDHLRNEMGLRLTVGEETQAVPVRIVAGMPARFEALISSFDPAVWPFLLRLRLLEATLEGLQFTEAKYPELYIEEESEIARGIPLGFTESGLFIEKLVAWLNKRKVQDQIRAIQEDVLGAYFFYVPEISLFWMVIGVMSGVLGVPVEALTVVVLAHELAHAYSHLGRDIDSSRWDTQAFARAEMPIAEGIAQFYTDAVCRKLEDRLPAALGAYRALLEYQAGVYRVHERWSDPKLKVASKDGTARAGEVVRSCMIECRKASLTSYGEFESSLLASHERLARQA